MDLAVLRRRTDGDLASVRRVLDCIADEVADDLDQAVGVGVDDRERFVELGAQAVLIARSSGAIDDLMDK